MQEVQETKYDQRCQLILKKWHIDQIDNEERIKQIKNGELEVIEDDYGEVIHLSSCKASKKYLVRTTNQGRQYCCKICHNVINEGEVLDVFFNGHMRQALKIDGLEKVRQRIISNSDENLKALIRSKVTKEEADQMFEPGLNGMNGESLFDLVDDVTQYDIEGFYEYADALIENMRGSLELAEEDRS